MEAGRLAMISMHLNILSHKIISPADPAVYQQITEDTNSDGRREVSFHSGRNGRPAKGR